MNATVEITTDNGSPDLVVDASGGTWKFVATAYDGTFLVQSHDEPGVATWTIPSEKSVVVHVANEGDVYQTHADRWVVRDQEWICE